MATNRFCNTTQASYIIGAAEYGYGAPRKVSPHLVNSSTYRVCSQPHISRKACEPWMRIRGAHLVEATADRLACERALQGWQYHKSLQSPSWCSLHCCEELYDLERRSINIICISGAVTFNSKSSRLSMARAGQIRTSWVSRPCSDPNPLSKNPKQHILVASRTAWQRVAD